LNSSKDKDKLLALIEALKGIGLTETQAKVYAFLLKEGTSNAKKTAIETKVPVERIYRTFEQLHELGLVRYEGSKPIRYSPISPELAIKNFYLRRSLELEERFQRLFECLGPVSELVSISQWMKEDILVFREEDLFLGLLKDLLKGTEGELLAIFSDVDRWLFNEVLSLLQYIWIPKVRVVLPSTDWLTGLFTNFRRFETRISKSKNSGLLIDKRRVALVSRKGDSPLIVVVLGESIIDPFVQYLESKWLSSIPIEMALRKQGDKTRGPSDFGES